MFNKRVLAASLPASPLTALQAQPAEINYLCLPKCAGKTPESSLHFLFTHPLCPGIGFGGQFSLNVHAELTYRLVKTVAFPFHSILESNY